MIEDTYNICGHTYDLHCTYPIVDGDVLRTNTKIAKAIYMLLDSVNYTFSESRPCPQILRQYAVVERKHLTNLLRNLCSQLQDFPIYVKDLAVIGKSGFQLSINSDSARICKVEFKSYERSRVQFCTLAQLPRLVDDWFKTCFTGKEIKIY